MLYFSRNYLFISFNLCIHHSLYAFTNNCVINYILFKLFHLDHCPFDAVLCKDVYDLGSMNRTGAVWIPCCSI